MGLFHVRNRFFHVKTAQFHNSLRTMRFSKGAVEPSDGETTQSQSVAHLDGWYGGIRSMSELKAIFKKRSKRRGVCWIVDHLILTQCCEAATVTRIPRLSIDATVIAKGKLH